MRLMTVADLRGLLAEFDAQEDANDGDLVVLQDDEGGESALAGGEIVNGVLFLEPVVPFAEDPVVGGHPQQHAKEREVIEYLVTKVLDPAALERWWSTPLDYAPGGLQGLTPDEAMRHGRGAALHEYVKHYGDGGFT